jgi:hypothetical protein
LIPVRFISGKTLYSYKVVPCPNSDNFWRTTAAVVYVLSFQMIPFQSCEAFDVS